jgi:hypothetical protein
MTDTLAQWRRALVLERINELCEIIKDREFRAGSGILDRTIGGVSA